MRTAVGCLVWMAWAALSHAQGDNLLANPGFETLTPDGTPEDWDLFVMPMEGAIGRVSAEAYSGDRAVSLFTPVPYPIDPANNWSQVVYGEFGNRTLEASVYVRTEEADGAELWIQCFQRAPVRVLVTGSSGIGYALTGTNGWTEISATVEAPEATSYVVVRCVIRGAGRVWFDDARLGVAPGGSGFEADGAAEPEPEPPLLQELERVREQMQAAVGALQESNEGLRTEIAALQSELASLRGVLQAQPSRGAETPSEVTEELERTRRDIEETLEQQAGTSRALEVEIDEIEQRLEQLRAAEGQAPPSITITTEPPETVLELERLRAQVEGALAEREPDAELRAAMQDIRERLWAVQDELARLAASRPTQPDAEPALPAAVVDELDAVREQMREVLEARAASDEALRAQVRDLSDRIGRLQARLAEEPSQPPAEEPGRVLEGFDALREQIQSALEEVRQTNSELQGRIGGLQAELERLREEVAEVEQAGEQLEEPPGVRHILVPRTSGERR